MILKKLQRLFGHGGAAASAATGPVQAPVPAALEDYLTAIADGRFSNIDAKQLCLLDREAMVRETAGMISVAGRPRALECALAANALGLPLRARRFAKRRGSG